MTSDPQGARDATVAALREAIGAVEATSADLVRKPPPPQEAPPPKKRRTPPKQNPDGSWPPITYPGMPEGDDWMTNLPARYHHGQRGYDRRIMEELAAVGVPCYTVSELADRAKTVPQGIPIFIDWLTHLEERIPGPDSDHRDIVRSGLICALDDEAARGNQRAIDLLIQQLRRQPPLSGPVRDFAQYALAHIATKTDFPAIAALIDELPLDYPRGALIEYLGRVKTSEAQAIALHWLDNGYAYFAIKALVSMKAVGVRGRVAPYVNDHDPWVRKVAKRAMERLPE